MASATRWLKFGDGVNTSCRTLHMSIPAQSARMCSTEVMSAKPSLDRRTEEDFLSWGLVSQI